MEIQKSKFKCREGSIWDLLYQQFNPNNFEIIENKSMLHYGSISICNHSNDISNETIKKCIYNSIDYITKNSSKRTSEWINISTSILNEIVIFN